MRDARDSSNADQAPSARRLARARRRGLVPVSPAATAAATFTGALLTLWTTAADTGRHLTAQLETALTRAPATETAVVAPEAILTQLAQLCGPVLLTAIAVGGLAGALQTGFLWSAAPLRPDAARLRWRSPLTRLWSASGLVKALRLLASTLLLALVCALLLRRHASDLTELPGQIFIDRSVLTRCAALVGELLLWSALCLMAIGALDHLWRRLAHRRGLRTTRAERRRERRESHGSPEMRSARRSAHRQLIDDPMRSPSAQLPVRIALRGADCAVLLSYQPAVHGPPWVTRRARGLPTVELLSVARARGLAEVVDEPLARQLSRLSPGATVPAHLQARVAMVLAHHLVSTRDT